MAERNLARVAAGALSAVGAGLALLWAGYVLYGLFTQSGIVEPIVQRIYGGPSVHLDFLIALVLGGALYWLANMPRRMLNAREPTHEDPGRAPAAQGIPVRPAQSEVETPKRRGFGLLVVGLFVLALLGGLYWYYMSAPGRTASKPASVSHSAPPGEGPEDRDSAVLNAVVQTENDFGQSASQSATAYARELGAGPQVRRGDNPQVLPLGHSAEQSIERLAAMLPKGPAENALHKLAGAYVAAARSLAGPLGDAERYYGRGAQNEDGWARGQALHAQLRAAFHDFFGAADALSVEARRLGKERRALIRAKLTAAGSVRHVSAMDAVDQGRDVLELLERRSERQDVDPAAMKAALAKFEATVDELRGLANDSTATERELGPTYAAASFGSLAQQAEYFLRTAKEVERETRSGQGSIPERSEEPGERLVRDFNDMVREANHLSQ